MSLPRTRAGRRPAGRPARAINASLTRPAAALATVLLAGTPAPATARPARHRHNATGGTRAPAAASLTAFEQRLGLPPRMAAGGALAAWHAAAARAHRAAKAHAAADRIHAILARMVAAGDRIAHLPYIYGGGHGSFTAAGYDCSGSVSYVLHGGGLLDTPMDSSGLEGYGEPGPGRHVTIYANAGHALMTIDGRRFDTIAFQETGTRWSSSIGDTSGYVVRHPAGL